MIIVRAQEKPLSDLVKVMGRMIAQSLGENINDFASPKPRVLDRTGLVGTYDFTLTFSCEGCQFGETNKGNTNGASGPPPTPTDSPSGLPDIFAAIQRELGLKLVKTKDVPVDIIVVDRVDKIPTAN